MPGTERIDERAPRPGPRARARRLVALLAGAACLAAVAAGATAAAQAPHGQDHGPGHGDAAAPTAGRAPDSDAPPGAPPHWLPHDEWVHLHWVPFDEARLQELLRASRAELWDWLRDDVRTLAELAARRGHRSPRALAAALVAPRGRDVSPATLRELRARTLRVLVQGHLSQHLIFHSLHQEAGPAAAARLFGVRDSATFRRLRRLDLSPLRIGRMHGRTRVQMQAGLERELRRAARAGVRGGHTSARQAAVVLQRQLRQVPRWLAEDHYNGPPQTVGGRPRHPLRPSFARPARSGAGRTGRVDAPQPAPALAGRGGEVVLEGRDLATGAQLDPRDASPAALAGRPCSSYGPSLSADGARVAFEVVAGNRTYAKRYGNVRVALADRAAGTVRVVAGGRRGRRVETAYDPSLSADGTQVAFQSVVADPMSPGARWASRVRVRDLATGAVTAVSPGDGYEPAISGDGRRVAYTAVGAGGRLAVLVFDRRTDTTRPVSVLGAGRTPAAEAWGPALSHDGRRVAFAATTRPGGRARVFVRDLGAPAARAVSGPAAGFASEPALSADGRHVAYAETARAGASPGGRPRQRIVRRDLAGGAAVVVSRDGAGRPLAGWSGQPRLSADGTRAAFTTDALTPPGGGPGGLQVLVRDLAAGTTTVANPAAPLATAAGPGALRAVDGPVCDLAPPAW